jgi:two-component system, NtrC family, response regulator HydG
MDSNLRGDRSRQVLDGSGTMPHDDKRVERTLKESEERHQTILEGIEEGYLEANLKGRVTFCNESFCRMLGYPMNEVLELDYQEYMTAEMAKTVYAAHNAVFESGIPHRGFYYEIIRKDGIKRIIENSISLLKDPEGHRIGFRSIVRDITDRKRIEEELQRHRSRLQAIFGSVKDAIITLNSGMVVVEANKAIENICGLVPKKIIGKVFTDCLIQCSKNCHEIIQKALNGMPLIGEYQIKCSHSHRPEQRVIITSSQLVNRDDNFMGLVIVIRDITRLSNLEKELGKRHQFQNIIGKNSKMQAIYELLDDLADLETTVLITGESGTGKSIVAKALHYCGNRALKPLVTVNCSALPESLLESELFGHIKGSFTGAIKDAQGRFQAAQGGTILLDEIGDISPRIQLKLLKVLQEKEFERVGESSSIKTDARVIACTNKDLKEKVKLGEFREDLYYRLKVVELKLPPLRERLEDIPPLVGYFCDSFKKSFQKSIRGLSDEVMHAFMNYRWPGNVRELEHSIEHAFVLCHDRVISLDHIPSEIREYTDAEKKVTEKLPEEKPEEVLMALNKTYWNKAKAARLLGIDRSTLYRKIRKYQLSKPGDSV